MTQSFYEKSGNPAENYQKFFVPTIGEPLAKELIAKADLHKGEKILDVACGTGIVTRLAAEKVGDKGKVDGLDINLGMLEVAKAVTPKDEGIEWHEASAASIPLPDNSFDVVMCQMGLQFVDDKPGALKEMHRVMKPEGRLVLNVPGPKTGVMDVLDNALEKHISSDAARFVETTFSLYDSEEIKNMLIRAGFHNIKVEQKPKSLHLPSPKDFLWQYINGTPLSEIVSHADEKSRVALEAEVVTNSQKFVENGGMKYEQNITVVTARK